MNWKIFLYCLGLYVALSLLNTGVVWSSNVGISTQNTTSGIRYIKGSFESAQKTARRQQRYIFVKAYADWCVPCKQLEHNISNNLGLVTFYNNNLINYSINVDLPDGQAFKAKYGVELLPEILFFAPNGKLIYRQLGIANTDDMLAIAQKIIAGQYDGAAPQSTSAEAYYAKLRVPASTDDGSSPPVFWNNSYYYVPEKQDAKTPQTTEVSPTLVSNSATADNPPPTYATWNQPIATYAASIEAKPQITKPAVASAKAPPPPDKNFRRTRLQYLQKKYDEGERSSDFLYDFAHELHKYKLPTADAVNKYLRYLNAGNLRYEKNFLFVYQFGNDLNTNAPFLLIANFDSYADRFGKLQVEAHIRAGIEQAVSLAAQKKSPALLEKALRVAKILPTDDNPAFICELQTTYFAQTKQWGDYCQTINEYIKKNTKPKAEMLKKGAANLANAPKKYRRNAEKWLQALPKK